MATISHQTVTLTRGKHLSAQEGACVLEVASMLAGERFTDHPASVCPVIGAFLRMYNDSVDDVRRQDLYRYASAVVGSRSDPSVHGARAAHLTQTAAALRTARRLRWGVPLPLTAFWCGRAVGLDTGLAVREFLRRGEDGHTAALALVDELLDIGAPDQPRPRCSAPSVTSVITAPSSEPATTSPG